MVATAQYGEAKAVEDVRWLFSATFPVVAVLLLVYIGLGKAVFKIFDVFGRRLPVRLRTLLRKSYRLVVAVAAGALHLTMLTACHGTTACTDAPLRRSQCLFATSIALVLYGASLGGDAVVAPLLGASRAAGFQGRVARAAAVCSGWITMADLDAVGIVLMLAVTARQALVIAPQRMAVLYLIFLKSLAVYYTLRVLLDHCVASASMRSPVAVTVTVMLI